jgi:hypothetical protein
MKRVLAVLTLAAPAWALACPVCARDQTAHTAVFLGAMIAAPYLVTALVVHAIRTWGGEP